MSTPLKYDNLSLRYSGIIGTGGIGSGKFFQLNGNHTLGREESRSGHFMDVNDYCKQHIILHYIKVLLGNSFSVTPIGRVGDDDAGNSLFNEMNETGFNMEYIEKITNAPTLFSFCFYYPDGTGGNLTTDNSASGLLNPVLIEKAEIDIAKLGSRGMIMAAPEVPFSTRQRLIEIGKQHQLFCSASFTSEEMKEVLNSGVLRNIDLIAINIDEASAISESSTSTNTSSIVQNAVQKLSNYNTKIMVSITAGKQGSWVWDGFRLTNFPAVETRALSTAGAGDAFFSGLLCGIALGLSISEAQQLATLIAGMSVRSPHTIHKGIDRSSLSEFLTISGLSFSEKIIKLLED
jgi:ribokinase